MNGLIWAGLGEGISKAGTTFGAYMAKGIEEEWKEERDAKRQEAAERRQQALEIIKEQMAEKKAAFLAKQDADTADAVETNTEAVLKSKGFQKFVSDLGPTEATPEQLAKIYLNTYHDRTVTAEPGGDRYDIRESERASERVNQARKAGASSGLLKSYAESAEKARLSDKEEENRKIADRKLTETERHNRATEDAQQERLAAIINKYSDNGSQKDALAYLSNARIQLKDQITAKTTMMKTEVDAEANPKKKAAIIAEYKVEIKKIEDELTSLNKDFATVKGSIPAFSGGGEKGAAGGSTSQPKPSSRLIQPGDGTSRDEQIKIWNDELARQKKILSETKDPDVKRRAEQDIIGIESELRRAGAAIGGQSVHASRPPLSSFMR